MGPEVSRCGDHLQALIRVVISFQEAAIRELMCGPGKQAKHSWQCLWRRRPSGGKSELTAIQGEKRCDQTRYLQAGEPGARHPQAGELERQSYAVVLGTLSLRWNIAPHEITGRE